MRNVHLAAKLLLAALPLFVAGCADADEAGSIEEIGTNEGALGAAEPGAFSFGQSRDERIKSIPVTGKGDWRVVYSVPAKSLTIDEKLAVRGEVTISRCDASDPAPCRGGATYNPKFKAKIVLGSNENDASGPDLSPTKDLTCTHATHHCTLVIGESIKDARKGDYFVNFVVEATDSNAGANPVALVEEAHGGLFVTRIGKGADVNGVAKVEGKKLIGGRMKVDNVDTNPGRTPHNTFEAKVENVRPGDILSVDAVINAKLYNSPTCNPLLTHQIFVTESSGGDVEKKKIAVLTSKNGTNCTGSTCTYRKSGAAQLGDKKVSTVFVTVVSSAGRSCTGPDDAWEIGAGSGMKVTVRR